MKSIILTHGSFGSPFENWFPWFHQAGEAKEIQVYVPHMPTPQGQTFENWAEIFDTYVRIGSITQQTIVIGHSSASAFLYKYALHRNLNFKSIITIAGFNNFVSGNDQFDKINSTLYLSDEELRTAASNFSNRLAIYSKNDPYLPLEVLENFAERVQADRLVIDQGGHFNASAGYLEFEKLFSIINDIEIK